VSAHPSRRSRFHNTRRYIAHCYLDIVDDGEVRSILQEQDITKIWVSAPCTMQ